MQMNISHEITTNWEKQKCRCTCWCSGELYSNRQHRQFRLEKNNTQNYRIEIFSKFYYYCMLFSSQNTKSQTGCTICCMSMEMLSKIKIFNYNCHYRVQFIAFTKFYFQIHRFQGKENQHLSHYYACFWISVKRLIFVLKICWSITKFKKCSDRSRIWQIVSTKNHFQQKKNTFNEKRHVLCLKKIL